MTTQKDEKMKKITVVGIGPGQEEDITPAVMRAILSADTIVGYKYYFQFIEDKLSPNTVCIDTGMKKERERAMMAFDEAEKGKNVCVISSGDSGIYGMAPLICQMKVERKSEVDVEVLPGISAFQKAAALLGAAIGHDLCTLSLSDLLTPWLLIEKRIEAAAFGDFVTAIYNPKSKGRYWQIYRLQEVFLQHRLPNTPVGVVRQAGREDENIILTTLAEFNPEVVDMFTIIIIGNSQSFISDNMLITPRGYYQNKEREGNYIGQDIMIESFQTIASELKNQQLPLDKKWALMHTIHTTADFDMENVFYADDLAIEKLHQQCVTHKIDTIITDVTMVVSGIRKGALERLGIEAKCYLHDPRTMNLAKEKGITRTQAGIRLAAEKHPNALYVFGNAPTALIELCELIRKEAVHPTGIIAAPVGFVNVRESKYMVKTFREIPKVIIEGRKGGSNLAATITNAILTLDSAEKMKPGDDM